ncbi:tellurite resistance protein TehB [Corynebacterium atrinae]|uniref:class I SAM-dependent methyltransferase n=1 Tax=Corynebacterium atrinae TaxID=1336740 RepID=UPI0025B47FD9|nr:class I SAM-dependent methyltransferase [Corynebacterium atrinae]WJY63226.1 tellurite resistance protein TehB [Corynebacterium atrinae]
MPAHSHSPEDFAGFYAEGFRWSGYPNEGLVREVSGMEPGTALDVGCGEGADVAWLAQQGWVVTGIDPVAVAIERTKMLIDAEQLSAELHVTGLTEFAASGREFDLVSCFYCPLTDAEDLLQLVAPGGTLLYVHHEIDGDARGWLSPADVAKQLGARCAEVTLTHAERAVKHGAGAHHHRDLVLRARR